MPRNFEFPLETGRLDQSQLWVPMSLTPEELSDQHVGCWGYHMVARLKDGVTLSQAEDDADRVAQAGHAQPSRRPDANSHPRACHPLREYDVADARPLLRTLFLCRLDRAADRLRQRAGLLLVRAIRRRRNTPSVSLWARSRAVIRESVFEGLLLGGAGGLLGLGFAALIVRAALHLLPESMPRVDSISLDWTVVSFALLVALATGALCSLAPAFAALRQISRRA